MWNRETIDESSLQNAQPHVRRSDELGISNNQTQIGRANAKIKKRTAQGRFSYDLKSPGPWLAKI
jgi:hypothetical protein